MTSVNATFDGEVVRTDEPLPLPPNARVVVSFEAAGEEQPQVVSATEENGEPYSFLKAVRAANLQGPPDWSERVDHYLYGTGFDD